MTHSHVLDPPPATGARNSASAQKPVCDQAFTRTLYEEHGSVLLRFALRLCGGDWHRAEDIVQEAAIRAWQHKKTLDPTTEAVRSWLFTVVRNLVIDHHRACKARPAEYGSLMPTEDVFIPDPAEQSVTMHVVTEAMANLSKQQQEVLLYTYYLGYSMAQTSQRLGLPAGTVKSRAYYALRALRTALRNNGVQL
jgi:RNA polymerase sigma-70 factor, ECF subfamily